MGFKGSGLREFRLRVQGLGFRAWGLGRRVDLEGPGDLVSRVIMVIRISVILYGV